jgi:hypothetical protein
MPDKDELKNALNILAKRLNDPNSIGKGLPLCGKCGQQHDPRNSECPPKYCPCCRTIHKPNEPFYFDNCTNNEHFKKYIAGYIKWQKQNTAEIWNQPDKEKDEEDEEAE